jgi:hypothetical protein
MVRHPVFFYPDYNPISMHDHVGQAFQPAMPTRPLGGLESPPSQSRFSAETSFKS